MTKAGWSRKSTLAIFIGNKYIVDVSDPFQDTVLVFSRAPCLVVVALKFVVPR